MEAPTHQLTRTEMGGGSTTTYSRTEGSSQGRTPAAPGDEVDRKGTGKQEGSIKFFRAVDGYGYIAGGRDKQDI
eukprot:5505265-Heterocapsa_arctica.AAC.1